MGISPLHARFIVMEHKRRPLPATVHLLGRQTVYLTAQGAERLIRSCGVEPLDVPPELDQSTRGAAAHQQDYISDRMFFAMLGVRSVLAIDYTAYEGAEVILDLNAPVPSDHIGSMDFVFGGSVLDNIFDGATYVANISKLLKPGGRFFDQNILSQAHHPYLLVSPAWLLDYYVVNRFARVEAYISEYSPAGFVHTYGLVPSPNEIVSDFGPPRGQLSIGAVLIVEKGATSSSDIRPIQDQYRSEADWAHYRECVAELGAVSFPMFAQPTALELAKLGVRSSKSYRYLGVMRPSAEHDLAGEPYSGVLPDSDAVGGLRVLQATYGANLVGTVPAAAGICAGYSGNVTDTLAGLANGHDQWAWTIEVRVLGDPFPSAGKDLEVLYYYPAERDPRIYRAYVEAEASGKRLVLSR